MSRDPSRDKIPERSDTGPCVSISAQSRSHVSAPVLSNTTITGNVYFTHNEHGADGHHTQTQTSDIGSVIQKYKELICREYQYVSEYNSLPGEQVLLSERFIQPLIIRKHRDQKEREEDIRSSSRSTDQSVRLNDLFDPDNRGISPRAVILQGNSGNGKSFTVQKIMMDWASGDLYKQRFDIVFHLKCKEINCMSGEKRYEEILSYSCSLTSDQISQVLQEKPEKMLFIVDGFDELRLPQDGHLMSPNTDLNERAPPEVTLCALLRGRILPESFLLVTTRSTASDTLSKLLKRPQGFAEIMGFSSEGVEKYFQGFFRNEDFFRKAYEYVKANETLITACSIPVICWIICTVMRERFSDGSDLTSGLETTTSIYADFVSTLLEHHCQGLSQPVPLLRSLGQLAEKGMLEQQVLLDEKMVYETVADPAGSPFLSKFLFKRRIHQEVMFSFMHLSFQEFFTALYYVSLDGKEFKEKFTNVCLKAQFAAVVKFLFGLTNEEVRHTLKRKHGVCVHPNTHNTLKNWLSEHTDSLETLHHLFELHEESFVKEVLNGKRGVSVHCTHLRNIDCWVLLYCGQCCQSMKVLNIRGWDLTSEKLAMILPVLHKFEDLQLDVKSYSEVVAVIHAVLRGRTLSSQSVEIKALVVYYEVYRGKSERLSYCKTVTLSISEELTSVCIDIGVTSIREVTVTFPQSSISNFDWTNVFQEMKAWKDDENDWDGGIPIFSLQSLPGLKKMELTVYYLTERCVTQMISLSENCPSLRELRIKCVDVSEDGLRLLQNSHTRPDCELTIDWTKYSPWGISYRKISLTAEGAFMKEMGQHTFDSE
ncbi:NACHT, LRR and PYD domains-containing protein 1 homolog [Pseudorasbora parva]|uniref:NACHT, LRR and PYD domains-containing protein 1 homolog n=1 Tax=Pseudorasbora parva TaxID=51549 RepID=UPI00351E165B